MGKRARDRIQAEARAPVQVYRIRVLPMLVSAISAALITALGFAVLVKHREVRDLPLQAAMPTAPSSLSLIDSLLATPSVPADAAKSISTMVDPATCASGSHGPHATHPGSGSPYPNTPPGDSTTRSAFPSSYPQPSIPQSSGPTLSFIHQHLAMPP